MKCTVNCVVEYTYTMEIPEDAIDEVVADYGDSREKAIKRLAEVYSEGEDEECTPDPIPAHFKKGMLNDDSDCEVVECDNFRF